MGRKSAHKGSESERWVAKFLQKWAGDTTIWRHKGTRKEADIILWKRLHVEVRNRKTYRLEQLILGGPLRDAICHYTSQYSGRAWMLFHNEYRRGWYIIISPFVYMPPQLYYALSACAEAITISLHIGQNHTFFVVPAASFAAVARPEWFETPVQQR